MPHEVVPRPVPKIPITVDKTVKILHFMTSLDVSPREFMYTFFSSTAEHEEIIYRRRLMKICPGQKHNKSILKNYGNLIKTSPDGQVFWESFILKEASDIVNAQEVERGSYPKGAYVSSSHIPIDFFSESSEAQRTEQIKQGMPFLHSLISQKILTSSSSNAKVLMKDSKVNKENVGKKGETPTCALPPENEEVLSLANLVDIKSTCAELADHKAEVVPVAICAMIAYTCNRCCNAVPLQNGLMVLAGGVSCRVNEYLQCFGLTCSRDSVLDAMEHMRLSQEEQLMQVFKVNSKLLPLLCFDNIDIHLRIHNSRIDMSSRLFHGTWGFYTVFRAALLANCEAEAVSLASFVAAMKAADQEPVKIEDFAPRPEESAHFKAVIQAQMATTRIARLQFNHAVDSNCAQGKSSVHIK
ncbi:uncharacterized protein MELLADRAFT_109668 [Melampsora larici-populina 98AG31]|uniref:Uncharacterized protein n=1 Tax=Melampsora larici-populina (strain 98AG31 / pathotype 3-4-7) TaxID=747676 RepID=F4RX89_MELLP|nr:uncharacterized protein MELLADRAFT_109668 [Melampsora larici-populina 98AG31]EGG02925.1 hypothetical protein MELLADRAFT_109668 [Melampsora larici-populina 98AG31]